MTSIIIPDSVQSIGDAAFMRCIRLRHVDISNKVVEIVNSAFQDCISLSTIKLPEIVRNVYPHAFSKCGNLSEIYYGGNQWEWNHINLNVNYGNHALLDAKCYFFSEKKPTTTGNYWHYVNGVPTKWE